MRVLFDKNVPDGVRFFLSDHKIETVDEHGWARISNGDLLHAAENAGFDVVITADQNIVYQQHLAGRKLGLVILGSNIWPIVRQHGATIKERVSAALPGTYSFIEMTLPPKPPRREAR